MRKPIGLMEHEGNLYTLCSDGAVFVLVKRGSMSPATGEPAADPHWVKCPAVPGTDAAVEQAG